MWWICSSCPCSADGHKCDDWSKDVEPYKGSPHLGHNCTKTMHMWWTSTYYQYTHKDQKDWTFKYKWYMISYMLQKSAGMVFGNWSKIAWNHKPFPHLGRRRIHICQKLLDQPIWYFVPWWIALAIVRMIVLMKKVLIMINRMMMVMMIMLQDQGFVRSVRCLMLVARLGGRILVNRTDDGQRQS